MIRPDGTKVTTIRKRTLRTKSVRHMTSMSHFRFRQFLLHKSREYANVEVAIVDESYTSRTCSCCGHVKGKFSSKTFKCPSCHFKADRDANAAKNIWLKFISDNDYYLEKIVGA